MEFGVSGAIQLANRSLAGRRPLRSWSATRFELSRSNLSAIGRKPGLRPARELVYRPAREPAGESASELDSVMEFGLDHPRNFITAVV